MSMYNARFITKGGIFLRSILSLWHINNRAKPIKDLEKCSINLSAVNLLFFIFSKLFTDFIIDYHIIVSNKQIVFFCLFSGKDAF